MIVDTLIECALARADQRKLKDVRAGLGYTCVLLEDHACGLGYTFRDELGEGCGTLAEAGRLIERNSIDIIPWAKSKHRLKAAIGLATINAVFNTPQTEWDTGNVTTALDVRPDSEAVITGKLTPEAFDIIADDDITRYDGRGYFVQEALGLMDRNALKLIKNVEGTDECDTRHTKNSCDGHHE